MANDIAYWRQECDHRIVDDLLLNFVPQREITPDDYIYTGPVMGEAHFGPEPVFGYGIRFNESFKYAPGAEYKEEADGTVTATVRLHWPSTLNTVRIFKRGSTDKDRVEIPEIEYEPLDPNANISDATYGAGRTYGTDHFGRTEAYGGGSSVVRDYDINWEMLDEQTLRLYNYDPDNEYYADYNVRLVRCPKCLGKGYLNDIVFDTLNRIKLVRHQHKVVQEVVLSLLRQRGSNPFFPNYGTNLNEIIGESPGVTDMENLIREQVVGQLVRIRRRQKRIINLNPDAISPREVIAQAGVEVRRDENSPDVINVTVTLILLSGERVRETVPLDLTNAA